MLSIVSLSSWQMIATTQHSDGMSIPGDKLIVMITTNNCQQHPSHHNIWNLILSTIYPGVDSGVSSSINSILWNVVPTVVLYLYDCGSTSHSWQTSMIHCSSNIFSFYSDAVSLSSSESPSSIKSWSSTIDCHHKMKLLKCWSKLQRELVQGL